MTIELGTKINHILRAWPQGTVATSRWFEAQGVSHQLAAEYEHSAWIERIGHGAFIKAGDSVEWQGALFAIQEHAQLPIHAGGKTALSLQGHAHFVSTGTTPTVSLFSPPQVKLPTWCKKHDWKTSIQHIRADLFSGDRSLGLTQKIFGSFEIQLSTRERAILELLYLVPTKQSYEEAHQIFEGLRTLRPELLQVLLEQCTSIKVKRLFLHLAELTAQPWFDALDTTKLDLGKGKRVIGEGGEFDSKYKISVPKIHNGYSINEAEVA